MEKCCYRIFGSDRWTRHSCKRNGSVQRNGRYYCKTHDPVRVVEKHRKREEKWNAEYITLKEKSERIRVMLIACEGVSTEILKTIKVKDLLP